MADRELRGIFDEAAELPEELRRGLLACIAGLIERDHDGIIVKRYLYELRIALRTSPHPVD